jgi:hypothetical protein
VDVVLPARYPVEPPACTADLPEQLTLQWRPGLGIRDVLSQFRSALGKYQVKTPMMNHQRLVVDRSFFLVLARHMARLVCPLQELWECLDDLDAHAWVLDGEGMARGSTQRRIALGGHASVTIDLAPTAPRLPPACQFLGAVRAVR